MKILLLKVHPGPRASKQIRKLRKTQPTEEEGKEERKMREKQIKYKLKAPMGEQ